LYVYKSTKLSNIFGIIYVSIPIFLMMVLLETEFSKALNKFVVSYKNI